MKYLAIQTNSEGRPCGWGLSTNREAAQDRAVELYGQHSCYPNETKGPLLIHTLGVSGRAVATVSLCPACKQILRFGDGCGCGWTPRKED